jgi:hypothetical protein
MRSEPRRGHSTGLQGAQCLRLQKFSLHSPEPGRRASRPVPCTMLVPSSRLSQKTSAKGAVWNLAPRPLSENLGIESTRPKPWFRHVGGGQENFSDEIPMLSAQHKHAQHSPRSPVLGQTCREIPYRIFMFRDPAEQGRSAKQTCSPRFLASHKFERAATAVVHRKTEDPPARKKTTKAGQGVASCYVFDHAEENANGRKTTDTWKFSARWCSCRQVSRLPAMIWASTGRG